MMLPRKRLFPTRDIWKTENRCFSRAQFAPRIDEVNRDNSATS